MNKKIILTLSAGMMLALAACSSKEEVKPESTQIEESTQEVVSESEESIEKTEENIESSEPETTEKTQNELDEENAWVPESSGKYVDNEILYDQIKWDEFEAKNEDIEFFGLPGSQWNWENIEKYGEGVKVVTVGTLLGESITFDELKANEGLLQNTVSEEGKKSSYDYPWSVDSSHDPDMYVYGFKPKDTEWDVHISFPTHDHNVTVSDAYNNRGFYLTAHDYVDNFNYRINFVLEAFGDDFYYLVCPHGTGIKNSFAGEYVELLMQKLGRPTGVLAKIRGEYFNNYQWHMYWERDGYVICLSMDEMESGDNWSTRIKEPILITSSAWDLLKEETMTGDRYDKFEDIRF